MIELDIFSDTVCPWCYIGKKRLEKAISIECGLQNGTLAIFVGTSVFGGGLYIIPAATYSVTMYLTSLIFIYFIRNR